MFDKKIPVYWDYDRDPENHFQYINGYSKQSLNDYTWSILKKSYEDLKQYPQYENLGRPTSFFSPGGHISQQFRSWNVNKESFIYPLVILPYLAFRTHAKADSYWEKCVNLDNELLDLVCKQKRGKICLYNNWEAWPAETYLNILNVLCSRYKEWNLQEVDFIISSCNELITSGNNVTHAVNSNLMPLATFDNAIQEKIIKGIEKKEHRKNNFICLNRVNRFHRMSAFAELWQDREHGIISQMCVQYGHPGVDEFQSIAGRNHTGQQWVDYIQNTIQTNPRMAWHFKKGLEDSYPESYKIYKKHELINQMPYMLEDDISPIINPVPDPNTQKFFDSSLNIVTETFGDVEDGSIFITEKTYKPIVHFQPFVIVAAPNTLLALKNKGYKTFEKWIDESYDSIYDNQTRLKSAIASARKFYLRDKKDIAQDLYEMIDILIHNRNQYQYNMDTEWTKLITQVAMNLNYCRRDI